MAAPPPNDKLFDRERTAARAPTFHLVTESGRPRSKEAPEEFMGQDRDGSPSSSCPGSSSGTRARPTGRAISHERLARVHISHVRRLRPAARQRRADCVSRFYGQRAAGLPPARSAAGPNRTATTTTAEPPDGGRTGDTESNWCAAALRTIYGPALPDDLVLVPAHECAPPPTRSP
jgi:hypothetical protein